MSLFYLQSRRSDASLSRFNPLRNQPGVALAARCFPGRFSGGKTFPDLSNTAFKAVIQLNGSSLVVNKLAVEDMFLSDANASASSATASVICRALPEHGWITAASCTSDNPNEQGFARGTGNWLDRPLTGRLGEHVVQIQ